MGNFTSQAKWMEEEARFFENEHGMKIVLSKSQWQQIGQKAGWLKRADSETLKFPERHDIHESLERLRKLEPRHRMHTPEEVAIERELGEKLTTFKTDIFGQRVTSMTENYDRGDGFYIQVTGSDFDLHGDLGEGPWETREDAEDYLYAEVGVPARVVEVRNGKPVEGPASSLKRGTSSSSALEKLATKVIPTAQAQVYMSTQNDPRIGGRQVPYVVLLIAGKRSQPFPLTNEIYNQADLMQIVNSLNQVARGAGLQANQIFG